MTDLFSPIKMHILICKSGLRDNTAHNLLFSKVGTCVYFLVCASELIPLAINNYPHKVLKY